MLSSLVVTVGLLVQAAGHPVPARAARAPDPVRVWRTDSIAYVTLREPGHLVLLNVDPIGRITVLFPFGPTFRRDRKSTRLNSSHSQISYAVFCLKKKKKNKPNDRLHRPDKA